MGWYRLGDQRWSIERDGTTLAIVESDGARRVEQLPTSAATTTRFTILTNQKLRAGWTLERVAAIAPVPLAPLREAPIVYDARNPALEAAIIEDPDDRDRWIVYGDWLQQQGDPRGELIARCAAVATDPRARQLVDARIGRFRDYFYDGLGSNDGSLEVALEWGFVRHVAVRSTGLADRLTRVLDRPSTRLLASIEIDTHRTDERHAALAVVGARAPVTLRTLRVCGDGWLDDLAPVDHVLPRLARLELDVAMVAGSNCLDVLAAAPLPRLEALGLRLRVGATLEQATQLLHRRDLPALVELSISAPIDAALCNTLATAPIARQLVQLTLPGAYPNGADALLAHLDAFPALAVLGLPLARIAPSTRVALERSVGSLVDIDSRRYDSSAE